MSRRLLIALASSLVVAPLALPLTTATTAPATATATERLAAAAPDQPALSLWAPARQVQFAYEPRTPVDLALRVIAQGAPFELWSQRASYDEQIRTVWRSPDGDVVLPSGSMKDFDSLRKFFRVRVENLDSGEVRTLYKPACLNGSSARMRPDAAATSPYPTYCYYNPYSLGSVQGVQEGWGTTALAYERPLRLGRGRYDVTIGLAAGYAEILGAPDPRTVRVIVKADETGGGGPIPPGEPPPPHRSGTARPAAQPPTGPVVAPAAGPVPNLRSLPAWGISMAGNGNYLRFAATVWNAGNSPLVVDGFRREGEDEMDAYQYFFDTDGTQTGYQEVGSFRWDAKPTHQHWHFEDFARYSLLNADQTEAVRSRKEAFCLANTDAVDHTVPGADWLVDNTDLTTACGDAGSLSIREVLASGWGDTYGQFRAGQSFDLRGLPNGTYYVAVIANPDGMLIESSTEDNVALREVEISGRPGARKVRVPQVGIVEEPMFWW